MYLILSKNQPNISNSILGLVQYENVNNDIIPIPILDCYVKRDIPIQHLLPNSMAKRWNGQTHIHPWLVQLLESCLDNMIATLLLVSLGHSELALTSAPCRMDGMWTKKQFSHCIPINQLCTQHPHVSTYLIFIMCLTYLPIYIIQSFFLIGLVTLGNLVFLFIHN